MRRLWLDLTELLWAFVNVHDDIISDAVRQLAKDYRRRCTVALNAMLGQ